MSNTEQLKTCAAMCGGVLLVAGSLGIIAVEIAAVIHYIHVYFPVAFQ